MKHLFVHFTRLPVIFILLFLGLVATSFLARRWHQNESRLTTAFGEVTGRSVPGIVEYYDKAAVALAQYLKSLGFSLMNPPPAGYEHGFPSGKWAGMHSVAERETYYKSSSRDSPEFYVIVRQPRENAAGLDVYVWWEAVGTVKYINSVKAQASDCCKQLDEWWHHYQEENRRPTGIRHIK
jgi:hypothetical protein